MRTCRRVSVAGKRSVVRHGDACRFGKFGFGLVDQRELGGRLSVLSLCRRHLKRDAHAERHHVRVAGPLPVGLSSQVQLECAPSLRRRRSGGRLPPRAQGGHHGVPGHVVLLAGAESSVGACATESGRKPTQRWSARRAADCCWRASSLSSSAMPLAAVSCSTSALPPVAAASRCACGLQLFVQVVLGLGGELERRAGVPGVQVGDGGLQAGFRLRQRRSGRPRVRPWPGRRLRGRPACRPTATPG